MKYTPTTLKLSRQAAEGIGRWGGPHPEHALDRARLRRVFQQPWRAEA